MFRRRDGIAERRIHHNDALGRRGGNIDIIDADASTADYFQIGRLRQDLRRHLGRRANRQPVIIADHGGELVRGFAKSGLEINLDAARFENGDRGGRQGIGDKDSGGHECLFLGNQEKGMTAPQRRVIHCELPGWIQAAFARSLFACA
jgi:hypothetical protein